MCASRPGRRLAEPLGPGSPGAPLQIAPFSDSLEFGWLGVGKGSTHAVHQSSPRWTQGLRTEWSRALRALAPGAAPCGLPPRAAPRQVPPGADGRPMEAVELPPVGMSWARAGLPALGPPPLKKGRSRQELMQRGPSSSAARRRRRPAAGRALDPLAGSRRQPDAQSAPRDGPRRLRTARGDGPGRPSRPPSRGGRGAAGAAGARRRAAQHEAPPRGGCMAAARRVAAARDAARQRGASTSRAARCQPSTPDAPRAERKPVTDVDDPRIEAPAAARGCPRAGET